MRKYKAVYGKKFGLDVNEIVLNGLLGELKEYFNKPSKEKLETIHESIGDYARIVLEQRTFQDWMLHIQEGSVQIDKRWVDENGKIVR